MSLRALVPSLLLLTGCWEVAGGDSGAAVIIADGSNAGGNGTGNNGWDSGASGGGDGGDGDGGGDGGDGGDGGSSVDSCDFGSADICYAYEGYDSTQTWCNDIGATYDIPTSYSASDCPGGAVRTCALPAGGDLDVDATAHYYSPGFDASSAAAACASAGGTVGS